jgi:hypothetical protein
MRKHAPQPRTQITKAATADPHILPRGLPEAQNTNAMQRAPNQRPNRTQCKGDPQLQPGGGVVFFGPLSVNSPKARPATAAAISNQPRSASQRPKTPNPDEAEYDPQLVVLASIDLRSQHGRLVSARVSVHRSERAFWHLGSCRRAASQAAGRAYRIPDRAAEEQATKRGRKRAREASQGRNSLSPLFAFFVWAVRLSDNALLTSYATLSSETCVTPGSWLGHSWVLGPH